MVDFQLKCSILETLYIDQKQSMSAIAREHGISSRCVKERLVECEIPVRTRRGAIETTQKRVEIDPELLDYWYWDLGMTTYQIAQKVGCNQSTIWDKLEHARPRGVHSKGAKRLKHVRNIRGHWMVKMPEHPNADSQGYVKEAILVWEKQKNEPFPEGCKIHYINGDINDLRIGNIRPMTNSDQNKFLSYARMREGVEGKGKRGFGPKCPPEKLPGYLKEWDELQETEVAIRRFDYDN